LLIPCWAAGSWAIRFEGLIRDGVVADQTELARLAHISRSRLTQVMNPLNLAPNIQEDVSFLQCPPRGRAPISERQLRPIAPELSWARQRRAWGEVRQGAVV